ncbi:hypothetical protein [Bradyrhizobium liaoningense]
MSAYSFKTCFAETKSGQCMYFLPGQSGMYGFVCGAPTANHKSYCDCHHKATHQPVKKAKISFFDLSAASIDIDTDYEPDLTEVLQ